MASVPLLPAERCPRGYSKIYDYSEAAFNELVTRMRRTRSDSGSMHPLYLRPSRRVSLTFLCSPPDTVHSSRHPPHHHTLMVLSHTAPSPRPVRLRSVQDNLAYSSMAPEYSTLSLATRLEVLHATMDSSPSAILELRQLICNTPPGMSDCRLSTCPHSPGLAPACQPRGEL